MMSLVGLYLGPQNKIKVLAGLYLFLEASGQKLFPYLFQL